jgi:uncharacterized membrane protein
LAGTLTIAREWVSNYNAYNADHVAAAQFIDANTPTDAMFVTADNHNNTISALTGRNIVVGTDTFLFFHGLNTQQRHADVKAIFTNPAQRESLLAQYKVDYIFVSDFERGIYPTISDLAAVYPIVFQQGAVQVLAVSPRAQQRRR